MQNSTTHTMQLRPRLIPGLPFPRISIPNSTHQYSPELVSQHIFDSNGKKQSINNHLKGEDSKIWYQGYGNEIGGLAAGINGRVKGTDTISFI